MKIRNKHFNSVLEIEPIKFPDNRGLFFESFNSELLDLIPEIKDFSQINTSYSLRNVLRGLHLQLPPLSQGKLCTVLFGEVLDVVVDVRPNSENYGKHVKIALSHNDPLFIWIPPGFAHGFLVKSDFAVFQYIVTSVYDKALERTIYPFDNTLKIDWKYTQEVILSSKDKDGLAFDQLSQELHGALFQ